VVLEDYATRSTLAVQYRKSLEILHADKMEPDVLLVSIGIGRSRIEARLTAREYLGQARWTQNV
jgi:hypothetical protein